MTGVEIAMMAAKREIVMRSSTRVNPPSALAPLREPAIEVDRRRNGTA